jgi:hypothetical protein
MIKSGSFQVTKGVMEPKGSKDDRDYLISNTKSLMIFKENFSKQKGLKKQSEIKIMIISSGRMVGDFEIINDIPSMTTIRCCTPEAIIKIIDRENFLKLKSSTEDWSNICLHSEEQQVLLMSFYSNMLKNI